MKKIILTMLAGLLWSCGLTNTGNNESSHEATRKSLNIPVTVDYAESMGLALLLGNLPHVIEISNCISFNEGETKIVEYLNENDNALTTDTALPGQLDEDLNEVGGDNSDVQGTINLYLGDTGCEADLLRFRHEGQFYAKAPEADQPSSVSSMVLYRAVDVPEDDQKEFWVQNLSDLDQIDDGTDTQIKFAVFKSFEKNQIERSINVGTEFDDQNSILEDLDLGRFSIEHIKQTYKADLRRETIDFYLSCDKNLKDIADDAAAATAWDLMCDNSDVVDTHTVVDVDATNKGLGYDDTIFYVFKRDASQTSFSIQEIINQIEAQVVGNNEELLGALEASDVTEVNGDATATEWKQFPLNQLEEFECNTDDAAYTEGAIFDCDGDGTLNEAAGDTGIDADHWIVQFNLPHSTLDEGSNALVLVVRHLDPYAPDDLYSSSYRYHLINLEYHNLD